MQLYAINAKNQLPGIVKNIFIGDIVSEVELETAAGIISSVITTSSLKILNLKEGDSVVAIIKATNVLLVVG